MKKDATDIEGLPSNSKASRRSAPIRPEVEELGEQTMEVTPKRVRREVPVRAMKRKKTFAQSIAALLFGDETRGVIRHVLDEVLVPAAKNTVQDMVTSAIEGILFGESGSGRSRSRDKGKSIVSYNSMYRSRDRNEREPRHVSRRDRFDLNDIYFRKGDEAADVLAELCDRLEEYDEVTVADFFELAGLDGATWIHNKWGWDNLKKAYITHTRNGYIIVLPEPIELE